MKRYNLLFIIALCAGLQFNMSLSSEGEPAIKPEPSYWQSYAPQFMQNAATSTSDYIATWIPQSVKDIVNKWSTRKKLAVAGTVLTSLLAIYNRDQIITWINDIVLPIELPLSNEDIQQELDFIKTLKEPQLIYYLEYTLDKVSNTNAKPFHRKLSQAVIDKLSKDPEMLPILYELLEQHSVLQEFKK